VLIENHCHHLNTIKTTHSFLLITVLLLLIQCRFKAPIDKKEAPLSRESTSAETTQSDEVIDSTHVVDLKNNYSIEQQFSAMNIQYTLVKKAGGAVSRLDSITTYHGEDYYYKRRKLSYDFKNDWCVFGGSDCGSNDCAATLYYVRVTDNRLKIILEYDAVASYVETESEPTTFSYLETSVLSADKKRIVLKSTYSFKELDEEGGEINDGVNLTDKATFMFNPVTGVFEFGKCDNPRFLKLWKGESFLDIIPL
jgi:hypothetical protein